MQLRPPSLSCHEFSQNFVIHGFQHLILDPPTAMLTSISVSKVPSASFHVEPPRVQHLQRAENSKCMKMVQQGIRWRGRCGNDSKRGDGLVCSGIGIGDFIGGDLVKFDLGHWLRDVEEHKSLAIYSPHEGGYEGRYLNRLRYQGYYFLDLTARGLGDPETTLTKVHPVCPAHLGKQPIARWYFPPEVDYRLEALPPNAKGLVVWIIEAKVLSKAELQFLALLPTLRPKVRVIAECGNWRKFMWKPLKEISGLTSITEP